MAELGWLKSSPAKGPGTGSSNCLSSGSSSFNSSNENLFDMLQGRLGCSGGGGAIFGGCSSVDPSPFFRSSDQMNDVTDSAVSMSLLKAEDDNSLGHSEQSLAVAMASSMQPMANCNLWVAAPDAVSSLGGLGPHPGLFNHTVPVHSATGMLVETAGQFSSYSPLKAPLGHDHPSPKLQALRDFMAYGPNNHHMNTVNNSVAQAAHQSMAASLVGPPMFLHLGGDESSSPGAGGAVGGSLLHHHLPCLPSGQMRTFVGENSSGSGSKTPDMMAYRALCQAELFATERSPHRTQFQRENHILAERQRREEMNEKFSALRSMIPKATKKDKASIVGDTIGYVLELEKTLKHLQACKASRKGYFKLLKKKASFKRISAVGDDLEFCDNRSMTTGTSSSSPPDLQGNINNTSATTAGAAGGGGAEEKTVPVLCTRDSADQCQDSMEIFQEDPIISSSAEKLDACADSDFETAAKENDILLGQFSGGGLCNPEVDVQNLGEQAVIKIVCARSPGLVLRILLALDECKVDVLQSNVTTVAEKSVHFITVQICSGLSSTTEEMIAVLHKASSSAP